MGLVTKVVSSMGFVTVTEFTPIRSTTNTKGSVTREVGRTDLNLVSFHSMLLFAVSFFFLFFKSNEFSFKSGGLSFNGVI